MLKNKVDVLHIKIDFINQLCYNFIVSSLVSTKSSSIRKDRSRQARMVETLKSNI